MDFFFFFFCLVVIVVVVVSAGVDFRLEILLARGTGNESLTYSRPPSANSSVGTFLPVFGSFKTSLLRTSQHCLAAGSADALRNGPLPVCGTSTWLS